MANNENKLHFHNNTLPSHCTVRLYTYTIFKFEKIPIFFQKKLAKSGLWLYNRGEKGNLGEFRFSPDMKDSQIIDNEIFFSGEFERSLDSQSRIAIPSEWRQEDGTRLILLPGRDNDLLLFPYATFRDFLLKASKLSLANRELQAALARIGAKARDCRCDKQGRIKLDKNMLESIGVSGHLKMIGALTHIKLCSVESWQAAENLGDDAYLDEFQKISESLNNFDLNGGL